ncbi:uncharacterized protein METZ01_LOCUS382066 [marine metagenome]|uniref:Uncharacterized protein n=1 Tax=marine metagenome TaxID=408172 RepID=A0A382U5E9_9ZZZZ
MAKKSFCFNGHSHPFHKSRGVVFPAGSSRMTGWPLVGAYENVMTWFRHYILQKMEFIKLMKFK